MYNITMEIINYSSKRHNSESFNLIGLNNPMSCATQSDHLHNHLVIGVFFGVINSISVTLNNVKILMNPNDYHSFFNLSKDVIRCATDTNSLHNYPEFVVLSAVSYQDFSFQHFDSFFP